MEMRYPISMCKILEDIWKIARCLQDGTAGVRVLPAASLPGSAPAPREARPHGSGPFAGIRSLGSASLGSASLKKGNVVYSSIHVVYILFPLFSFLLRSVYFKVLGEEKNYRLA